MNSIDIRVVDQSTWPDLQRLFESRGGPSTCWCMVWRATAEEARHADGPSRRLALERRVQAGEGIGLLGYVDGQPIAWCSVAPRPTFRRLGGGVHKGVSEQDVWSIVCFYVTRAHRGGGALHLLLDAAVRHARKGGAAIVEGYPVDPESPSYRFMGFVAAFAAAGFTEVGRAGSRRHVMALRLREPGGRAEKTLARSGGEDAHSVAMS